MTDDVVVVVLLSLESTLTFRGMFDLLGDDSLSGDVEEVDGKRVSNSTLA